MSNFPNFILLLVVATATAFLLWQFMRPWKKKSSGDKKCDKCE